MNVNVADRFGPYEIVRPISSGGMGEVYLARDMRLERDVALKMLPADRAGNSE
jgi:serine/threonine protein kinase